MHEAAIRRYAALAVPRYTSFPTAVDFTPITPDSTKRWLRQIGPEESVSLYIHVPYCKEICHYCGCHSKMAIREDVIENFVVALLSEIETVSASLTARPQVVHLHWGGGTLLFCMPRSSSVSWRLFACRLIFIRTWNTPLSLIHARSIQFWQRPCR